MRGKKRAPGISMTSHRRYKEIQILREEGRQAALVGKHRQTNPHRFMDRIHWADGVAGIHELELASKDNEEEDDDGQT
jgi:hypothetical protein